MTVKSSLQSIIQPEDPALVKISNPLVPAMPLRSTVRVTGTPINAVTLDDSNSSELSPTNVTSTTTFNSDKTLYITNITQGTNNQFFDVTQNNISGGVGSLNSLDGDINIVAGSNITVATAGDDIVISSSIGSGTSGFSGASGTSGFSGAEGTSGFSGAAGTSGFSGAAGTSGFSGAAGTSGFSGASGTSGFSGATGLGLPAGANTEIQYNFSGTFGASSSFTWNNANSRLSVDGTEEIGPIHEQFSQVAPAELTIDITFIGPPVNEYVTNITIVSGGSGFTFGQQIFVPGTNLGGVSPANDRILTILGVGVNGSITSVGINSDPAPVVGTYNFNPVSATATTNIYYLSAGVSSFNANSINLAQDYCTNFLLVITQGATPLVPNSFSIDGVNVPLLYPGGTLITGTASSTDVVNISVFKTGASSYTAFAQIQSFS